jgi:hypothetical protein
MQQLVWFAVLAGPLACSIYDEGLGDPPDSGVRDGASGGGGRRDSAGTGGAGSSGAGGETEGGVEEDASIDAGWGGGSGGTGGRNDASFDVVSNDANRGDTGVRADADALGIDTGSADSGGGAADIVADRSGGSPDVDASQRDGSVDVIADLNAGIDADPDRRGATPDGGPVVGVFYNIIAQHSGKCMSVLGNLPLDKTDIVQWTCDGSASQRFRLQAVTASSYVIVHPSSNKCVDVLDSGTADLTNVQLYTCNNTAAQIYALKLTQSTGFYTMVNPNSGKCVDVDAARMADLANIQIYTCNGATNQAWEFVNADRDQ